MPFKIDELYYELDARTTGFENNINRSRTTLGNFAQFIRDKPMLAVGALAAALIAVGIAATKMANDVDIQMRKVQAAFPAATAEVGKLRDAIADLSEVTPRSQRELAEQAAQIAESGVETVDEIIQRLTIIAKVGDATGIGLETITEGLDNISDAFRLTATESEHALVTIFGFAQGKVGIDEVFQTLARGGAVLADLGVKAEDAGQAMVALIDAGIPRRQAGTVLTTILELTNRTKELRRGTDEQRQAAVIIENALSRENIAAKGFIGALGDLSSGLQKADIDTRELGIRSNQLSAITRVAEQATKDQRTEAERLSDSYDRLAKAAQTNNESASALSQLLVNQLNRAFIDLGNIILPSVISGLKTVVEWLRRVRGESNIIGDVATLTGKVPTVGKAGPWRRGTRFESEEQERAGEFEKSIRNVAARAKKEGAKGFAGISVENLQALQRNVDAFLAKNTDLAVAIELDGQQISYLRNALTEATAAAKVAAAAEKKPDAPVSTTTKTKVQALTEEVKNAIASLKLAAADALITGTTTQIDDARQRVAKFRQEVAELERKAGRNLPELRAALGRMELEPARVEAKERADAAREIADEVARAMGIQSVAMAAALDDFNKKVAERNAEYAKLGKAPLFTEEQIGRIRELRQALIDTTKAAEATDAKLLEMEVARASRPQLTRGSTSDQRSAVRGQNMGDIISLELEVAATRAELEAINAKDEASLARKKSLLEQIAKLQAKINELTGQNAAIADTETEAFRERIRMLREQASWIGQAAGLAAELASAFGEGGQQVAGVLVSIGKIGTAIKSVSPLLEQLRSIRSGAQDATGKPVTSIGDALSTAQSVIGGIVAAIQIAQAIFGATKWQMEQIKRTQDNTHALRSLTQRVGDLGKINVTGGDVGRVSKLLGDEAAIKQILINAVGFGKPKAGNTTADILERFGLDAKQLVQIAEQFGVAIDAAHITMADLQKLAEAIKQSELTQFADTFAGQMQSFSAALQLFPDLNTPTAQLNAFIKALKNIHDGGGILQETLEGFDLATAEGVAAAEAALQGLFKQLQEGTLTPEELGGLTPGEYLEAILKAMDIVRAGKSDTGTGGFNVDRTITEVTAQRQVAMLSTAVIFLEQIRDVEREILRVLSSGFQVLPGINPPATTGTVSAGTSLTVTFTGDIIVQIPQGTTLTPENATAVGEALGGAFAREAIPAINRGLANDLAWRKRAAGSTLVT